MWMGIRYDPGTVKVVTCDEKGNAMAEKEIRTAGKPYGLVLEADRAVISADGKDLAFITVSVTIVESTEKPGTKPLEATASGLGKASIKIQTN